MKFRVLKQEQINHIASIKSELSSYRLVDLFTHIWGITRELRSCYDVSYFKSQKEEWKFADTFNTFFKDHSFNTSDEFMDLYATITIENTNVKLSDEEIQIGREKLEKVLIDLITYKYNLMNRKHVQDQIKEKVSRYQRQIAELEGMRY